VPWVLFLLALGAAGMLGYHLVEERAQSRRELSTARDEAAELRRALFSAQDKLVSAERDVAGKGQTLAALQAALAQKGQQGEENEKLLADLRSKLDAKEGDISQDQGKVTVNLVDEILFKSGDADLSARGKEVLGKVGGVLKGLKDKQILIGGHTDDNPIHTERFPSNWELSAARAVNVVHYLVETVGVEPRVVTAAAYSEFHPRAREKSKNRRIEILLTPLVDIKKK
jgi:chemotaxis protein MotB